MVYIPTISNPTCDSYRRFMELSDQCRCTPHRMVFNASYDPYTNRMGLDSDSKFIGGFYDYMEFPIGLGSDGCIWI
jgi:hypothetical protein